MDSGHQRMSDENEALKHSTTTPAPEETFKRQHRFTVFDKAITTSQQLVKVETMETAEPVSAARSCPPSAHSSNATYQSVNPRQTTPNRHMEPELLVSNAETDTLINFLVSPVIQGNTKILEGIIEQIMRDAQKTCEGSHGDGLGLAYIGRFMSRLRERTSERSLVREVVNRLRSLLCRQLKIWRSRVEALGDWVGQGDQVA